MNEKEKQEVLDAIEVMIALGAMAEGPQKWQSGESTLCSIKVPKGFKNLLDDICKNHLTKDANSQDGLETFLNDAIRWGIPAKSKDLERKLQKKYENKTL